MKFKKFCIMFIQPRSPKVTEETIEFIYLGIIYPDLTLNHANSDPTNSVDLGEELLYNSASSESAVRRPLRNLIGATLTF